MKKFLQIFSNRRNTSTLQSKNAETEEMVGLIEVARLIVRYEEPWLLGPPGTAKILAGLEELLERRRNDIWHLRLWRASYVAMLVVAVLVAFVLARVASSCPL